MIVIIILLLILLLRYIMTDVNTLTGMNSAQTMQQIDPSNLATSEISANSSNFTYSIWFYIDDWNYRYGESKVIFGRMAKDTDVDEPCPVVTLSPMENNIVVSLAVYPGSVDDSKKGTTFILHTCGISNIPIQKWCNLLISAYGRTLDIYLDGKLVRTCVLPGVAKIDATSSVYVTPAGGFSGWTSKFQYWPDATDPQTAWNIYQTGYGVSFLASIFGRYNIKLSLMSGENEQTSYVI